MGRYAGVGEWLEKSHRKNVKAYGAKGDGVTDDTLSIQGAISACSAGDTVFFPQGTYILNHATTHYITVTTEINFRGEGRYSIIWQKANYDSFVISTMENIIVENLYFVSDATSAGKASLNLTGVACSTFKDLYFTGGYYGIYAKGCLTNTWENIRTESSVTHTPAMNTLVYMTYNGEVASNGNVFIGLQARGGVQVCDNGIYFNGTTASGATQGDITLIGTIIEGTVGTGISINNSIQGGEIRGGHSEGTAVANAITLTNCSNISISGMYLGCQNLANTITLNSCNNITISHCFLGNGYVNVNLTNYNCEISNCHLVTAYLNIDPRACRTYNITDGSNAKLIKSYSSSYYSPKNLVAGDLEATWVGSPALPPGFVRHASQGLFAEETTIIRFGAKSCKMTNNTGIAASVGLGFNITGNTYIEKGFPDAVNYVGTNWSWTLSVFSGTPPNYNFEYFLKTSGGADPALLLKPLGILQNNIATIEGTIGALTAGQWDYGYKAIDGIAYNTIYVRLSDSTDPDTKTPGYVQGIYAYKYITVSAWFYKPATNGVNPTIRMWDSYTSNPPIYFTIPAEQWTRCIAKFAFEARTTSTQVICGMYLGANNGILYVDGIEIREGEQASPTFCE